VVNPWACRRAVDRRGNRAHLLTSSYEYQRAKELTILDIEVIGAPEPTVAKPTPKVRATPRRARVFQHSYGGTHFDWSSS
jgi:hypothetical protein